jgi:hypothetical protein
MKTKDKCAARNILFAQIPTAILFFIILLTVSNVYCSGISKLEIFDRIITPKIAIGKDASKYPFALSTGAAQGTRDYIFELQFKKTDPYHHYICSISVASAGTFINPQQYQKEYNRLLNDHKRAYPDRWHQRLLLDFPDIGARAQWGHISAGPGGASFQLMFTTSDGRYDIKALISNLLPENVESPDLELEQIAKAISDHYNKAVKD